MSSRIVLFVSSVVLVLFVLSFVNANQTFNRAQLGTIESYMNASADPCTDFYEYACGNWENVHESSRYTDSFEFVDYKVDEEYGHILKSRRKTANRQKHFVRQVLSYYKSCISVDEFEPTLYIDWMRNHENITWPDIESTNQSNSYDVVHMLATLRKYGLNGILLSETLLQKRDDSRHYLIDIDRPAYEDEFQPLTKSQFKIVMQYFDIESPRRQLRHWRAFKNFELKIGELYDIDDDAGFEEVKIEDIGIPQVIRYLEVLFDVKRINPKAIVSITNRPYMRALFNLLSNYEDEFLAHYISIRFMWHLNNNGPTSFGKSACISNVRQQMPLAMVWLYEQHNPFLMDEVTNIEKLFENLRANFLKKLNENPNNLSDEVVEFLRKKLKSMQLKIGNLPRNGTVAIIEQFYRDLTLTDDDFYVNHLKLLRLNNRKHHERLNTTVPRDIQNFYFLEDTNSAATSTPFFLQRHNLVIVPLTLLHLPFYHPQLSDVFKYSLVGFLLAHEITHGFDESGLDYDQHGNMQETSNDIKENKIFDSNFDCLLAKNPRVIDEKIADVSGLRWAFEAFFQNTAEMNKIFPWTQVPQSQLFFLNFALFFCGALSNDKLLANSSHGTWRSRLHDSVSQFPKFGEVFHCRVGSEMNPPRKCQLWR